MLTIYELMQNIDMAEDELKNIDRTLYTLDHVLKLVSIIKYVKPITVPIRNAVSSARNSGIKKALIMVKKVRQSVTGKYKPKIKKALTKNEQVRSVIAKSRFLNQNLLIITCEITYKLGQMTAIITKRPFIAVAVANNMIYISLGVF